MLFLLGFGLLFLLRHHFSPIKTSDELDLESNRSLIWFEGTIEGYTRV